MAGTAESAVVRLATRGSPLARAQTELAIAALRVAGVERAEAVVVSTTGDRRPDVPIAEMDGEGWFTAELERALLDGRADIAVHSAKDLPSRSADGLRLGGLLRRGDVRDAVVTRDGVCLGALPAGARVGTSSPRRAAFVRALNAGIDAVPIRGNVDTRLAKLDRGEVDALLVAAAGLERLGLGERITERLDPSVFVPAPAQGAIALQVRDGSAIEPSCSAASDEDTFLSVLAERAVLAEMGGGCRLPLGAWARMEGGALLLTAALAIDGAVRKVEVSGSPTREGALDAGRRAVALLQGQA